MLNFRNTNWVFAVLTASLIGIHYFYGLPWYVYLLAFILYSLVVFYGCYHVGSGFFIPITCSAQTTEKVIAISFDDGPAEKYTPQLLQLLQEHDIEAAFFCIGNRITGNETLFKRISEEGHVIGNHSYSHHTWFDLFSTSRMLADMKQMDQETMKVIGIRPRLFRPPYGVTNPNLARAIRQGDYIPVGWNVRSFDTVIRDEHKLLERVSKGIKPGAVFLFHDTCASTLAILPVFIEKVKAMGYRITRLDKMLNLPPYA
ncbi:MAG: polysaccharide deacetylase family protein [Chitinophagaceae bacterium]|nr:polysaccharide deacetylase family protein [Chitinophagaceae bacterium]